MRNFIKNQIHHYKKRVPLRSGTKIAQWQKTLHSGKIWEEENKLIKKEQIVDNIIIWSDDQQKMWRVITSRKDQ